MAATDDVADTISRAVHSDRSFCVWAAAYVLSFAESTRGGTPAEVIKTMQSHAWNRNLQPQALVLSSLSSACEKYKVTWANVGQGGNV